MKARICLGAVSLGLSLSAVAADGVIGPLTLDSIALIAAPIGSHKAGNMEIAVHGGFAAPAGLDCGENYWVTTLKTADPDRSLLSALRRGQGQTVRLFITDDAGLTAFPNRCSIKGVELVSRIVIN